MCVCRCRLSTIGGTPSALDDTGIVARVALIDPDGVPGSGDELFETVAAGGAAIELGTGQIHKDGLDAIFRTALVISF